MKAGEIGKILERSTKSIWYRIEKLRGEERIDQPPEEAARYRRYTAEELELISEMVDIGMSWTDIAAEHFPERSGNSVRDAYKTYQARKQRNNQ